ncbi:longitudinals lacking protein, isoforms A/B/D/L-like [Homalodisca vitripennis]|uniref:longitudinals lacking protein, isoforms A/B/D/L-like n=1 Tax=Homalodisca vitripennis TaxID=197043 RepID=UPI001EEA599A|nr:longitudinals lacking protein, isoforms A/B/D/L-like [Homalodisca vitripennis]KAG8259337.1 hypothetical protein J6590_014806 [Homalodisca vitripennis]
MPDCRPTFMCGLCGRKYFHKKHLNRHQRYECGKDPQFACPYCPYRAKQKICIKAHLRRKHPMFFETTYSG